MDLHRDPQPLDLALQLPRDMYYQLIHTLCAALPAPITDTQEDRVRRDNAVIAQIASLLPANADEANLAAQYIAAQAQALDCQRLARLPGMDLALVLKCSAQAASMLREARAARSMLMRVQAARQKRETDAALTEQAAWTEHCAIGLMAEALGRSRPAPMAEPVVEAEAEPLTEAERYAVLYPRRAALIRSLGGLPEKPDFGPPEPELVQAIVSGTSPRLLALDSAVAD